MNLEEAIAWYFSKKKEDEKIPSLSATVTGRMKKSVRTMDICRYCGRNVPQLELTAVGYCSYCARELQEKQEQYELKAKRLNTKLDWGSVFAPSVSGGIIGGGIYNNNNAGIELTSDKAAELEQKVRELTEEIEKLKGMGIELSGENVLVTGRKFRKKEEEAADELCDHRGEEAE